MVRHVKLLHLGVARNVKKERFLRNYAINFFFYISSWNDYVTGPKSAYYVVCTIWHWHIWVEATLRLGIYPGPSRFNTWVSKSSATFIFFVVPYLHTYICTYTCKLYIQCTFVCKELHLRVVCTYVIYFGSNEWKIAQFEFFQFYF